LKTKIEESRQEGKRRRRKFIWQKTGIADIFPNSIAYTAGLQVLRSGGVVRGITNWGQFRLPRPTVKHQSQYSTGYHFIMRFDSSASVQISIRRTLGLDPRMIRFSVVKLGSTLDEIKDVTGNVEWNVAKEPGVTIGKAD
jgi:small subunit ribosomal protein S6